MRILIIGGSGFVGEYLNDYLHNRSHDVISTTSAPSNNDRAVVNVLDRKSIDAIIENVDAVVNLAAISGVIKTARYPQRTIEVNAIGMLNVLESIKERAPHIKMVSLSSRLEHGTPQELPVSKSHPLNPETLYGISKFTGTKYSSLFRSLYGIQSVILRVTNIYGPQKNKAHGDYNIINLFIEKALQDEDLVIFGDGSQMRDYIHIEDICSAIEQSITIPRLEEDIFNIGFGEPYSIKEFAHIIVDTIGKGNVKHVPWPEEWKSRETGDFYYDISHAKNVLQWSPTMTPKEGIEQIYKFYTQ